MEINREDQWVTDQLAVIEPQWRPDTVRARGRLDVALRTRSRVSPWMVTAATAAVVCIAVAALPQTRAKAQELWDHFVLGRVDVVRVDLSDLPVRARITTNGMSQNARDIGEAEQLAGFKPNLPVGVLSANPSMTVTGP